MELFNAVVDYLNQNQPLVVAIAGLLAVFLQYAINHVKGLGKLTNYTLGIIALPGVTTAGLAFGTSLHLTAYPWVVVVGQLIYAVYEKIKANAAASTAVTPDGQAINF